MPDPKGNGVSILDNEGQDPQGFGNTSSREPTYVLRLLPEVREAIEEYARDHNITPAVVIAEACRAYVGRMD